MQLPGLSTVLGQFWSDSKICLTLRIFFVDIVKKTPGKLATSYFDFVTEFFACKWRKEKLFPSKKVVADVFN